MKTGDIFPAQFTDKGPDMDLRTARTLTGGEAVGLMDIYDYQREELRIGPFTYEPMRAVDIWLQQTDEFVLQSLHPCPEVSPPSFLPQLRQTLKSQCGQISKLVPMPCYFCKAQLTNGGSIFWKMTEMN